MKTRAALLLGSILVACTLPDAQTASAPSDWQRITGGALVEISVERTLYEAPGAPHFFVHVRVENLTARPVAVDLRKRYGAFYLNQWGASSAKHRGTVDEIMFLRDAPFGAADRERLLRDYGGGELTPVPPNGVVEYFDGSGSWNRAAVDAQSSGYPYVLVVMAGELSAADGRTAECVEASGSGSAREVAIPTPVPWARLPPGALVVSR